ncbi:39S ribosomal protein L27, mitochondrial [Chelonus insularis]|uniref:39S ribosomal protein L27, mitochondrial n=1 Tax=Chelonus insularis TaxID=460826 RepID=UPI001588DA9D|nr:39S ribosomal protein L27, mitochondrial [Chelonus insularis]
MSLMCQILCSSLKNSKQNFLSPLVTSENYINVRNKAVKVGTTTRNRGGNMRKPKHRGWKVQDGEVVRSGTLLATQMTTRFHPGLYVGFGKNGTLYAMEPGKVMVTCEKTNLKWDHTWIQRCYSGRENQVIYKKHFNVIPEKQHNRFKLIDTI